MMARTHLPLPCSRLQGPPGSEMAILDPPIPGKHRLVVPVAPVAGIIHPADCRPSRPVPILAFHGTEDPILGSLAEGSSSAS